MSINKARAAVARAEGQLADAVEWLKREEVPPLDPKDYIVGFFDDLDQLREVWGVFLDYGCNLVREDFTYQSVTDYDGGYWNVGSVAGLFYADLDYGPSNESAYVGFRCALGHKNITPQKFIELFKEEE